MRRTKRDFDRMFELLCRRNEELDQQLAAALSPHGLSTRQLLQVGWRLQQVDRSAIERARGRLRREARSEELTWGQLNDSLARRGPLGPAGMIPAHWIRV